MRKVRLREVTFQDNSTPSGAKAASTDSLKAQEETGSWGGIQHLLSTCYVPDYLVVPEITPVWEVYYLNLRTRQQVEGTWEWPRWHSSGPGSGTPTAPTPCIFSPVPAVSPYHGASRNAGWRTALWVQLVFIFSLYLHLHLYLLYLQPQPSCGRQRHLVLAESLLSQARTICAISLPRGMGMLLEGGSSSCLQKPLWPILLVDSLDQSSF